LRSIPLLYAALILRAEMRPISRRTAAQEPNEADLDGMDEDDHPPPPPAPPSSPAAAARPPFTQAAPQTPSPVKIGSSSSSSSGSRRIESSASSDASSSSAYKCRSSILETINRLERQLASPSASGSRASTGTTSASTSGSTSGSSIRRARMGTRPYGRPAQAPRRRVSGLASLPDSAERRRVARDAIATAASRYRCSPNQHRGASSPTIPSSAVTEADTSMATEDSSPPESSPSPVKVFPLIDLDSDSDDDDFLMRQVHLSFFRVSYSSFFPSFSDRSD
jgi:hypothetical protein